MKQGIDSLADFALTNNSQTPNFLKKSSQICVKTLIEFRK